MRRLASCSAAAGEVPVVRALFALVLLSQAAPALAALTVVRGLPIHVTLATTVQRVEGASGADWISIQDGDVDVYIVVSATADGAALPANGWWRCASGATCSLYIGASGQVGLAGSGVGEANVMFR